MSRERKFGASDLKHGKKKSLTRTPPIIRPTSPMKKIMIRPVRGQRTTRFYRLWVSWGKISGLPDPINSAAIAIRQSSPQPDRTVPRDDRRTRPGKHRADGLRGSSNKTESSAPPVGCRARDRQFRRIRPCVAAIVAMFSICSQSLNWTLKVPFALIPYSPGTAGAPLLLRAPPPPRYLLRPRPTPGDRGRWLTGALAYFLLRAGISTHLSRIPGLHDALQNRRSQGTYSPVILARHNSRNTGPLIHS